MPNYSVESEVRHGVEIFTLRGADAVSAEIAPTLGNNCFAFRAPEPVLEPVPFEEFLRRPTSYGIPILFPYPNRIADGVFSFRGERFAVNPNRHGYVRDKAWTVTATGASNDDGAWITSAIDAATYSEQILPQFPFPFHLEVTYRLKDRTLVMEILVRNVGERDLPFGFGIHPYFRSSEDAAVQVPAHQRWELAEAIPTGNVLDVAGEYDLRQPRSLTGLALDDIYTDLISEANGQVRCLLDDKKNGVQTLVEFDAKEFPHVVAYTAPAPRQAVCIEPYTCPTDGFNLQNRGIESNIMVLEPGASCCLTIRISQFREEFRVQPLG